jgi:SAM-dependent methyltransferase
MPATTPRFQTAAPHYLAGRPAYADLLIRRVADLVGLQLQHRVLDLGCGPGQLARAFAPRAGSVVGVDPEPEMLRIAKAESASLGNIRYIRGSSEDLPASSGPFRLVVMGRSFHWMDRARTLRALDPLVEPGGALALFSTGHADLPHNAWVERYDAVRRRYRAADPDRAGRTGAPWRQHEAVLLDSPFSCLESHVVFEQRTIDAQSLRDRALSMSSTEPARLGARIEDLMRDLGALIAEIAPGGELTEVVESRALIAHRPGEAISRDDIVRSDSNGR